MMAYVDTKLRVHVAARWTPVGIRAFLRLFYALDSQATREAGLRHTGCWFRRRASMEQTDYGISAEEQADSPVDDDLADYRVSATWGYP